ncbi:MAG: DNA replication/repair protein RecF [Candidatus Marinimicrobia bacterium]|nr:DNA replication/repair protein RecF [Candidatus Neomarinimicrobiota bacterium]
MKIKNLKLINFRNYDQGCFEFSDNLHIIFGDNGTGKTTLLEAIHFLSLTKSFRTNNDINIVKKNRDYFQIFGKFLNFKEKSFLVNLNFSKNEGKKIFINKADLKRKTDIVGRLPVVIFSPENQKITDGGPLIRRNFINRILSQVNSDYFQALIEYKKRIYNRNLLLNQYRSQQQNKYDDYINTIDEMLVGFGAVIQKTRADFIEKFNRVFCRAYKKLVHYDESVSLQIIPNIQAGSNEFEKKYKEKLYSRFESDMILGRTGAGPHLDNILLLFGDKDIRLVGSQGEHKMLLVALKIAEGIFIEQKLKEPVIFLLDDLFAMLDVTHCVNIINEIGKNKQTIITTTDVDVIKNYGFDLSKFNVKTHKLPIGVS